LLTAFYNIPVNNNNNNNKSVTNNNQSIKKNKQAAQGAQPMQQHKINVQGNDGSVGQSAAQKATW